jgi:hypothetical protein
MVRWFIDGFRPGCGYPKLCYGTALDRATAEQMAREAKAAGWLAVQISEEMEPILV